MLVNVTQAIMMAKAIEIKVIMDVLRVPADTDFSINALAVIVVLFANSTCLSNISFAL